MNRRLLIFVAALGGGVLAGGGVAAAYWSMGGGGNASATTTTLAAPTGVVASSGSTSAVSVQWTASTAPNGGSVTGYYVERYSGATASAACGTSSTSLLTSMTTSCNDTSTPDGTYTYKVTAVFRSWTSASTASSAVVVHALDHFAVSAPASATAGTPFSVTITAMDVSNQTVSNYVGTVHFVSSDTGSPVLPVDYSFVSGDSGTHTFTNGVTLKTTPSQSITVNDIADSSKTGTTSVAVAGAATKVVFSSQPGGGTGGTPWTNQPVVTIQDANGNTVTSSTATVTLAISANPGGGTLTCTTNPLAASSGVATFAGCTINKLGTGYTLIATATGLTSATSTSFNVTVGAAAQLAFTTQPSGGTAAVAWATQPAVTVQDAGGNTVTSSSASVTLAVGTNPGGGTLTCTTNPVTASSGVATFAGCKINKSGAGYTLAASSAGLTSGTSGTFTITAGAATQLGFTTQPAGATGGTAWTTQPVATIQDANGNTVTSSSASVTLAISTNPSGGTLTCTTNPVTATSGVATFAGCKINKSGNAYKVRFTSTGLTSVTSSSFNVTVGAAAQLAFSTQPSTITAGDALSPSVAVTVQDAGGNTVTTSSATVTLAIGTNPGAGTLTCTTNPVNATSGVATFNGCAINNAGTGYTLTAAATGLTSATSSTFTVNQYKLVFTTQPSSGTAGAAFGTQPVVTVQDYLGNTITSSSASVSLAIGTNPGAGTLTCTTNPVTAASGVATFAGCSINNAGTGYTLTATATGMTSATSTTFTLNQYKLVFTTQPGGGTGGTAWGAQPVVTVQDANGTTITASSASITLAIGTNPGGGTLTCITNPVTAVSGVATFAGCKINVIGTGYTLTATATGITSATSNTLNVAVGAATQLAFTTQPASIITAGVAFSPSIAVTVQDAGGNTVTSSSASVTLAIGTNPGGGTLTCTTNPGTASSGVATFSGCSINNAGTGYTLTAAATGLTSATSSTLTVNQYKLVFTTQPGGGTGGTAWTTQPVVTIQDYLGNTITSSSASVTLAIGTNVGGGTLTCTTNPVTATSGVATFAGCKINLIGTGYTLTATAAGMTAATSNTLNITVGAATQLAFTTQPGGGTHNVAWAVQPVVTVQDAGGNTVTSSSATVTLAIASNPGGSTLVCTATVVNATAGVVSYAGCRMNLGDIGYTLKATSAGLTTATSTTFSIN